VVLILQHFFYFFFSSRRRHTRSKRDWSSDVCSSDLVGVGVPEIDGLGAGEPHRAGRVDVIQGAGEGDDADLGGHLPSPRTTSKSSMTVLASKVSARRFRSSSETESSTSSSNRLPWRTSDTPETPMRPRARWTAWPCGSRI